MLYKILVIINDRWFVYFDADVRIDETGETQNLVNWKRIVLKSHRWNWLKLCRRRQEQWIRILNPNLSNEHWRLEIDPALKKGSFTGSKW